MGHGNMYSSNNLPNALALVLAAVLVIVPYQSSEKCGNGAPRRSKGYGPASSGT